MSGRWRGRAFEPAPRLGTVGGAEELRMAVTRQPPARRARSRRCRRRSGCGRSWSSPMRLGGVRGRLRMGSGPAGPWWRRSGVGRYVIGPLTGTYKVWPTFENPWMESLRGEVLLAGREEPTMGRHFVVGANEACYAFSSVGRWWRSDSSNRAGRRRVRQHRWMDEEHRDGTLRFPARPASRTCASRSPRAAPAPSRRSRPLPRTPRRFDSTAQQRALGGARSQPNAAARVRISGRRSSPSGGRTGLGM